MKVRDIANITAIITKEPLNDKLVSDIEDEQVTDEISNSDEEMLSGVPPIKKGNKMEGQFFPLLFDPSEI